MNFYKLLLFLVVITVSCNQVEETEMDDFIHVEIDYINKKTTSIGLRFKEANDGILMARIHKDDFDDFEHIASNLKENQKLKIKGVIHDFNYNEKLFPPDSDSLASAIITVKEIIYID